MRRYLVAGNWKMNTGRTSARELGSALAAGVEDATRDVDVLVCPPFLWLESVADAISGSGILLGGQNAWCEGPGAFTGEVAVEMLQDVNCRYLILGHSERRHLIGETDEQIGRKVHAALALEMNVILCVGELLAQREADEMESVLDSQLAGALSGVAEPGMARVVIAYEPVWAIGTGVTATPEQADQAHRHIRNRLASGFSSDVAESTQILYGGSVGPDNALNLMRQPNVDGALVGGASLRAESFLPIVRAAVDLAKG